MFPESSTQNLSGSALKYKEFQRLNVGQGEEAGTTLLDCLWGSQGSKIYQEDLSQSFQREYKFSLAFCKGSH